MALEMVRDQEVERALLDLLREDNEVWNITKLQKRLGCSRRKVEISVGVLQERGLVLVRELRPSWIITLALSNGNDGEGG